MVRLGLRCEILKWDPDRDDRGRVDIELLLIACGACVRDFRPEA